MIAVRNGVPYVAMIATRGGTRWGLPKGAVGQGETSEAAALREVFEETGLHVTAGQIAVVFERIMPGEAGLCEYHYVLVDFYCTVKSGELRPGDDSKRTEWVPLDQLPEIPMTQGTLEVIQSCRTHPATCPHVTRPFEFRILASGLRHSDF